MKTIHIKNYVPLLEGNFINTSDIPKLKTLIRDLYEFTLKDDPRFHFFFEPEIIIRIDSEDCLTKVKEFLKERNIDFEEYEYPFPPVGKYGEGRESIVAKNLDTFLSIFHINSIAAIKFSDEEHLQYLERVVHTAFNPKFYSYDQEGKHLFELAKSKLGRYKMQELLNVSHD